MLTLKSLRSSCLAAALLLTPLSALAVPMATVDLFSFIQSGTITNDIGSGANITQIIYDLGGPEDNLATWDSGTGGGTASNFLSDPSFFQTITWTGLSIAPGGNFGFGGLDIDLIETVTPLSAVGSPLGGPETLRLASVTIFWSNGQSGSAPLVQQNWDTDQHLTVQASSAVPEPGTISLFAIGLAALLIRRRRR
jgi:hypothetical protein